MAMDITLIFKTCVKTIRTRNRACGILEPDRRKNEQRKPNDFALRARDVLHHAAKIAAFVSESKSSYLNWSGHISGVPQMTDSERDRIDWTIPKLASMANNLLKDLDFEINKCELAPQYRTHQQAVVRLLRDYLRHVTGLHSDMRAARIAKSAEVKKMSRLDASVRKDVLVDATSNGKSIVSSWSPLEDDAAEESLSPEELQIFEEENQALQAELNSLMDDARQLEGKVTTVAQLQDTLTEKVLEQEHDISSIATGVIGTTENLKDANEQLRQAIQRNAGFRVYILFFLLVMSFSLLFLDWY